VQLRGLLHLSSSFFVCNLIYAGLDDTWSMPWCFRFQNAHVSYAGANVDGGQVLRESDNPSAHPRMLVIVECDLNWPSFYTSYCLNSLCIASYVWLCRAPTAFCSQEV
jgi:hypothetical protein